MTEQLAVRDLPAGRFGQLLSESRHRTRGDLELLAAHSCYTVGQLSDIENGHRPLKGGELGDVLALYETDFGLVVPQRHPLRVDLTERAIVADGNCIDLRSTSDEHVLDQYLSLVYRMRQRRPGTALHLRDEDLEILAESLAEPEWAIAERLTQAMGLEAELATGVFARLQRALRTRRAVRLLGLFSIGTVVFGGSEGDSSGFSVESTAIDSDSPKSVDSLLTARVLDGAPSADSIYVEVSAAQSTQPDITPEAMVAGIRLEAIDETELNPEVAVSEAVVEDIVANSDGEPASSVDAGNSAEESVPGDVGTAIARATPAELGQQGESLLRVPPSELIPGWTIEYQTARPGLRGLTLWQTRKIEIYVRDSDTPVSLAGILAHEIGHAIDVDYLQDVDRHNWLQARAINTTTWWPESHANDFSTGAGDFAEAFAYWAVGDPTTSQLAGTPTPDQLALIETFIARA